MNRRTVARPTVKFQRYPRFLERKPIHGPVFGLLHRAGVSVDGGWRTSGSVNDTLRVRSTDFCLWPADGFSTSSSRRCYLSQTDGMHSKLVRSAGYLSIVFPSCSPTFVSEFNFDRNVCRCSCLRKYLRQVTLVSFQLFSDVLSWT